METSMTVFSHEVYSFYMLYAFVFPLAGGALPFSALALCRNCRLPGPLSRHLYHFGIAAMTAGSVITGFLEIYGTTNRLTRGYWYAGAVLVLAAFFLYRKKS